MNESAFQLAEIEVVVDSKNQIANYGLPDLAIMKTLIKIESYIKRRKIHLYRKNSNQNFRGPDVAFSTKHQC